MWNEGTREGFLEEGTSLQALGAKWVGPPGYQAEGSVSSDRRAESLRVSNRSSTLRPVEEQHG